MAAHLGMERKELLSKVSSQEMTEWMAYNKIEPFGEYRADIRNAILCQIVAQANTTGKRFKISDFIPVFYKPPQTAEDMKFIMQQFAERHNAKLKGNR